MVRNIDYELRRKTILAQTINRYIKEAIPISSEDIAQEFDLSPASIRKIFAELEEVGYITHPYTSGGRIPTKKGYRYYVDFLISQMEILEEQREHIDREYKIKIKGLEEALEKTSEIIATVTHYAGITSFLEWQNRFFYKGISLVLSQPEFKDVERIRLLIEMLEDRQHLLNIINRDLPERVKIYIGEELGCPQIENCSLVVSSYSLKNRPLGRLAVLGPMRMDYRHIIPALEYISNVLTETLGRI